MLVKAAGVGRSSALILRKILVLQEAKNAKRPVCRVGGTKTVQIFPSKYPPEIDTAPLRSTEIE